MDLCQDHDAASHILKNQQPHQRVSIAGKDTVMEVTYPIHPSEVAKLHCSHDLLSACVLQQCVPT